MNRTTRNLALFSILAGFGPVAARGAVTSGGVIDYGLLVNVSTRGWVETSHPLIQGFVVSDLPRSVIIRALGPTLQEYGVSEYLIDPKFSVYDSSGEVVASNDNWGNGNADEQHLLEVANEVAGAIPFIAATGTQRSRDAALVIKDLEPGAYTVVVSSAIAGLQGEILCEVYALDPRFDPDDPDRPLEGAGTSP